MGGPRQRSELRTLYTASKVTSFIVVIPGVGASSPETWGKSSGEPWLKALLLNAVPSSSILCFDHGLSSEETFSWLGLAGRGTDLLDTLLKLRDDVKVREYPILFVCHSLGGIILKQALCFAHQNLDRFRDLLEVTSGLILMGTPHSRTDSEEEWRNISLIPKAGLKNFSKRPLTSDEKKVLGGLSRQFETIASPIRILTIYETRETRIKGWLSGKSTLLVERELSLTHSRNEEEFKIDTDHYKLCDFGSRSDAYRTISSFIRQAIQATQRDLFLNTASRGLVDFGNDSHLDISPPTSSAKVPLQPRRDDDEAVQHESLRASRFAAFNMISQVSNFSKKEPRLPCYLHGTHVRNPTFFGRQDILKKMADALLPPSSSESEEQYIQLKTFGLCGLGGIGKTETAVEFMFSYKQEFDAVFWVPADEPAKIADGFRQIAIELGLENLGTIQNQAVSRELVKSWLTRPLRHYRQEASTLPEFASWLLVFDNVDDPLILTDYWPNGGIGSILVTSRDPLAKTRTFGIATGIQLQPFDEKAAAQFLVGLTYNDGDSEDTEEADHSVPDEAVAVAIRLGGLPLALTQMAGVINRRELTYREFLELYDEQSLKELNALQLDVQKTGYKHTLSSVWALDRLGKQASLLLDVIALMDPDRIPEEILTIGSFQLNVDDYPKEPNEYQKARAELQKSSLITRNRKYNEIRIHRLTQDGVRAAMTIDHLHKTFDMAVSLISAAWPFTTIDQRHSIQRWQKCESLFPHVLRLKNLYADFILPRGIFKSGLPFAKLLNEVGWYFYERSIPENCEPFFKLAQLVCETQGEDALDLLSDIHYSRGADASEVNDPERCMEHTSQFFKMRLDHSRKSPQGRRDLRLAVGYNQMGVAYMMIKDYESAVKVLDNAFEVYESLENSTPIMATLPAANMGLAYWFLGKYDEAYDVLIKILREREKVFGENDSDSFKTGRVLHALGNVTASQGRLKDSFSFHQRALMQYRSTIGDNHHRTADVCHKVAEHYIRFGKLEDARKLLEQALQVFSSRIYYRHEKARTSYLTGRLLAMLGDEQKSENYFKDAFKAYQVIRPEDSRPMEELSDIDFDNLVCFWSR